MEMKDSILLLSYIVLKSSRLNKLLFKSMYIKYRLESIAIAQIKTFNMLIISILIMELLAFLNM